MGEKRSNHTVYNVNYHFVWCSKYRRAIFEQIEDSLEACFRDVCPEYGYEILSLYISLDHVHLFLSDHPKHTLSERNTFSGAYGLHPQGQASRHSA